MTKVALGGRASQWAVTCVKPEQASKVAMRMPTRLGNGEGSTEQGRKPVTCTCTDPPG